MNAYSLTGRRSLYGLFPSQFKHPTPDIYENPQVNNDTHILSDQVKLILFWRIAIFLRNWKTSKQVSKRLALHGVEEIFWSETFHYELRKILSRR